MIIFSSIFLEQSTMCWKYITIIEHCVKVIIWWDENPFSTLKFVSEESSSSHLNSSRRPLSYDNTSLHWHYLLIIFASTNFEPEEMDVPALSSCETALSFSTDELRREANLNQRWSWGKGYISEAFLETLWSYSVILNYHVICLSCDLS